MAEMSISKTDLISGVISCRSQAVW